MPYCLGFRVHRVRVARGGELQVILRPASSHYFPRESATFGGLPTNNRPCPHGKPREMAFYPLVIHLSLPRSRRGREGRGEQSRSFRLALPLSGSLTISSDTVLIQNSFRRPTSPPNRQPIVSVSSSRQLVDDFVGELTFLNHLVNTLGEIIFSSRYLWLFVQIRPQFGA